MNLPLPLEYDPFDVYTTHIAHLKRIVAETREHALRTIRERKTPYQIDARHGYIVPSAIRTHLFALDQLRQELKMPAKKTTNGNNWKGFIACELTVEDKNAFRVWDVDESDAFDIAMGRCQEGYRVAFSFNAKNDSYTCSMTGQENVGENAGYTLSAFGKTALQALRVLIYKDQFVLGGVWTNAKSLETDDIG